MAAPTPRGRTDWRRKTGPLMKKAGLAASISDPAFFNAE